MTLATFCTYTQLVVFVAAVAVTKNLWNVYLTVRRDGAIPSSLRRSYLREFYVMTTLCGLAAVMCTVALVLGLWSD